MRVLETERLLLRELELGDAPALARILSDQETMRYYPAAFDPAQVLEWIARNQERYAECGCGLYAMVLKSGGELVGDCGLSWKQVNGGPDIEVGYHARRDLWGQGLATEAAGACIADCFRRLSPARIIALIRPENQASRRVAEKLGMRVDRLTT